MPRWLRHLFVWTALLAFAVGAKLHLPLVQAAGWARMTVGYASVMPLRDAVETALSGRELCGACEFVRSGENAKHAADELVAKSFAEAPPALTAPADPVGFISLRHPVAAVAAHGIPEDCFAEPRYGRPETPPPMA